MCSDLNLNLMGIIIQTARLGLNLSQNDLAKRLNISVSHLSHIETGVKAPSISVFRSLCIELNLSPIVLLQMNEENFAENTSDKIEFRTQLINMLLGYKAKMVDQIDDLLSAVAKE